MSRSNLFWDKISCSLSSTRSDNLSSILALCSEVRDDRAELPDLASNWGGERERGREGGRERGGRGREGKGRRRKRAGD